MKTATSIFSYQSYREFLRETISAMREKNSLLPDSTPMKN